MVQKSNAKFPLGSKPAPFKSKDTITDKVVSIDDYKDCAGLVVAFICNHCPYVKHIDEHFAKFAASYQKKNIGFIAISSNDADTHPQDGPKQMKERGKQLKFPFPYIYDEDQSLAKAYDAACTPEFYLFGSKVGLIYHGRYDASSPGRTALTDGADLALAIESLLSGNLNSIEQHNSVGCSIKWK